MHGNLERTKKNLSAAASEMKRGLKTIGEAASPLRARIAALYARSPLQGSKLLAFSLIVFAVLWISSGFLFPHQQPAVPVAQQVSETFRVAVTTVNVEQYQPKLVLSGRTEADKKVAIVARTQAIVTELRVKRGDRVKAGDVLAILTDDGRNAQLQQARALVQQRKAEYEARTKLIEQGNLPKLDANAIASQLRAAEAALAQAEAEVERIRIVAPWDGVVDSVAAEQGQFLMLMPAMGGGASGPNEIARMIALDPIIAIAEVSEKRVAGVKLGEEAELRLVSGEIVKGKVRYISKSASATTRTYRVDVEAPNPDHKIPDGITAEVAITMATVEATKVPRSALTFSAQGKLGVRAVNGESKVMFIPVELVDDAQQTMWVKGIPDGTRVIVQGQDFVRENQVVEAVTADQQNAQR